MAHLLLRHRGSRDNRMEAGLLNRRARLSRDRTIRNRPRRRGNMKTIRAALTTAADLSRPTLNMQQPVVTPRSGGSYYGRTNAQCAEWRQLSSLSGRRRQAEALIPAGQCPARPAADIAAHLRAAETAAGRRWRIARRQLRRRIAWRLFWWRTQSPLNDFHPVSPHSSLTVRRLRKGPPVLPSVRRKMGERISHDPAQAGKNAGLAVYRLSANKAYDLGVESTVRRPALETAHVGGTNRYAKNYFPFSSSDSSCRISFCVFVARAGGRRSARKSGAPQLHPGIDLLPARR